MKTFRIFFTLSVTLFTFTSAPFAQKSKMVSKEQIKQNIYKAYESLSKRDYATFKTVCATDFTEYTADIWR